MKGGDAVYVEKPAYEPLLPFPGRSGAEVFRFERPFERGFGIDPEEFEKGFPRGPSSSSFTNLHNPSGVRLSGPKDIKDLAEIAAGRGAYVLVDEVYLEFEAGGWPHTPSAGRTTSS